MKMRKIHTYGTLTGKRVKDNTEDKVLELREDCKLFTCMLLMSKLRPNINLEETDGRQKLYAVPRSMFAANCTMPHCLMKSSLMAILGKLPRSDTDELAS